MPAPTARYYPIYRLTATGEGGSTSLVVSVDSNELISSDALDTIILNLRDQLAAIPGADAVAGNKYTEAEAQFPTP
ncbi:MAG: hypothetical protein HOY76_08275 [Streptomyces sp.]|nr:hypothetical protein [Streptomyces sp.]